MSPLSLVKVSCDILCFPVSQIPPFHSMVVILGWFLLLSSDIFLIFSLHVKIEKPHSLWVSLSSLCPIAYNFEKK